MRDRFAQGLKPGHPFGCFGTTKVKIIHLTKGVPNDSNITQVVAVDRIR
jgi:hypothetical protein